MEQQILKVISHIRYVSKKGLTIEWPVYKDSWKKIYHCLWWNLFGRNYIQKLQQESKINVKSKIVNPIYDNKHFAEDFLEIHFHTCSDRYYISDEAADICIKYLKIENWKF